MISEIKKALAERDFRNLPDEVTVADWLDALVSYYEQAEAAGFINPSDKLQAVRKKLEKK